MATSSLTIISPPYLPSSLLAKPNNHNTCFISCKPLPSSISSPLRVVPCSPCPSRRELSYLSSPCPPPPKTSKRWKISAFFRDNFLLLGASTVENSQELVSTSDDGVSSIISVLLFAAFIGLSILTIGVVYIAVTDFLQKREREKFEKEEAAKKKKGGKKEKIRSRARAGPRGFGQKIEKKGGDDDGDDSD